jgi:KilA-N domain
MFFKKKREIVIQDNSISIHDIDGEDYICLTDMIKAKEGEFFVKDWLRNRNTLEFLGIWEQLSNANFNWGEFALIKNQAGLNSFNISTKEWVEKTNAIGIVSKSGRYGGTYAHKDIAFEFGTWISPAFKLYLIKEYQRLKEVENNQYNLEWDVKRILSKTNYHIHTDAVKNHVIPISKKWIKEWEYAEEADILNLALFGCTAKDWQNQNPQNHKAKENIRDSASINELLVLSNLQSMNATMMRDKIDKKIRFEKLQEIARHELIILNDKDFMKSLKKSSDDVYLLENKKP